MPQDIYFTVVENYLIAKGVYLIKLRSTVMTAHPLPGQFAMIKIVEGGHPILRRPLSYSGATNHEVQFIYKVVGEGTGILSQIKKEEQLKILGPLGKGFDLSLTKKKALLVGGGIGFAPLLYLTDVLTEKKLQVTLIIGAKSLPLLPVEFIEKRAKQNTKIHFATEDGSIGWRGMASDLLTDILTNDTNYDVLYSCGPMPMLNSVAQIARKHKIPCEVSVEAFMACGLGACMSCVVRDREGEYLQVCKEGPVFKAEQLFGEKSND